MRIRKRNMMRAASSKRGEKKVERFVEENVITYHEY